MLEQIWQYIIGPIVAEAINQPASWNGVEAVAGYNFFNTVAWALLALSMVLTAKKLFEKKEIKLKPSHAVQILPIIFMGGLLRFVQDSMDLNFYIEILLITPIIYIWMGSLAALFIYLNLSKGKKKIFYTFLGLISVGILYLLPGLDLIPLTAISCITALFTGVYWFISQETKYKTRPLVLAVSSQLFEGLSSGYAVTQGFEPRQLLTSNFVEFFGPSGVLIMKTGILAMALHVYFDLENEWKTLLLIALYSIGFGTGLRVLLRALTGV